MQHFPQFQFLISDPGGCFVSNELREWASIRGIGLLTAPGEFHGLTTDMENLIRVIKRLARQLADDHPSLTLASCVSLACFSHNNGFKTGGYSPVQWAFEAENEGTVSRRRCPLKRRLSGYQRWTDILKNRREMPSAAPSTRFARKNVNLEPGNLGHVLSPGQGDSRSDWRSIQVRALAGTCTCYHDRSHSTMEWVGTFHDRTNWCCLVIARIRCSEREVSIASLKGLVEISVPTSVTELTNALSPGQYEDLSTDLPTGDDLRFGEVLRYLPLIRKP